MKRLRRPLPLSQGGRCVTIGGPNSAPSLRRCSTSSSHARWRPENAEDRVLVTKNVEDFVKLARARDLHPGVILLEDGDLVRDEQLRVVRAAVAFLVPERDLVNRVLRVWAGTPRKRVLRHHNIWQAFRGELRQRALVDGLPPQKHIVGLQKLPDSMGNPFASVPMQSESSEHD
jgi:hypothetical protein